MQYVDYKKKLQERLNNLYPNLFEVVNERNLAADGEKVQVVLRQLVGQVLGNSATIPFQMDIITDDPEKIMEIFTAYAKNFSNSQFNSIVNEGTEQNPDLKTYLIIEYLNTPTVMEAIVDGYANKMSRIVLFSNLTVLKSVSNIKSLTIDDESIEFNNATISYMANIHENRISGEQLNKSKKREASVKIAFSLVNKDSVFGRKLFRIMFGLLDGNTKMDVKITLTNGLQANVPMIIDASTLTFSGKGQVSLPTDNVSLVVYDDRGE